jgi:hypothetical protein
VNGRNEDLRLFDPRAENDCRDPGTCRPSSVRPFQKIRVAAAHGTHVVDESRS